MSEPTTEPTDVTPWQIEQRIRKVAALDIAVRSVQTFDPPPSDEAIVKRARAFAALIDE